MRRAALVALASLAGTLAACGGSDAPDGPVVQIAVVADGAAVPLAEGAEGTLGLELTLRSDEPVTVGSLILRGPLLQIGRASCRERE